MKKRLLSILMTLALCLGLLPTVALAEGGVSYLNENGDKQTCASATEVTRGDTNWSDGWYVVRGNMTIGTDTEPQRVTVTGDVHLILTDGCELTVTGGIQVAGNNNLTIYAQSTDESTMGKLTATGSSNGAGIGGGPYPGHNGGTITINGGTVIATSTSGAGIGGGGCSSDGGYTVGGNGGTITINGGTVTATSTNSGAGIGGGVGFVWGNGDSGYGGSGGDITINGGTVNATGTTGAGIGGGGGNNGGSGGEITICGGTVTASSTSGAGIGGGKGLSGGKGDGGTFQTTDNGNAVIFASSIGYQSNQSSWSGVIFEGDADGKVYGTSVTPIEDFTIDSDKKLTIPSGASLTIPEGKTLTNKGTISIDGGTMTNKGTIINNGGTITGTFFGIQPKVGVSAEYLDETGTKKTCDTAIVVESGDTTWGTVGKTTWYVVQGDVSISQGVTFSGDVHLILEDRCDLTVENGIESGGNLTIYAQSTGDAQGRIYAVGPETSDATSCGILVSNMTINGGSVTATGGSVTTTGGSVDTGSYGILAGNLTISGGSVGAKGSNAMMSYGIFTDSYLTITGGTVTATGNDAETISCGIYVHNQLTIDGSTVKAEVGSAADSNGIYANKQLTITDSTVKVKVGDAKDFSKGIATFGSVTITGGSVEVKAGTAGTSSTGILASGDVTITGGSHVTVHAPGNGSNGHAMNKSPQLPEIYWWRTADTDPFTASGTAKYKYKYSDTYVEFTDSFTITLDPNFDGGESGAMTTGADGKLTGNLPTPTRDGYTFDSWFTAATGGEKVTNETVFNGYVTIYAHWMAKSSGGSSTPTYPPTVTQPENGTVTVNPKSPRKGDTVTITPTPDAGYTVEQVLVTDKNGDAVEVTNNGDGTYSFTQPAGKVDVEITFMEDNTMLNFFVDVPANAYYYDAVLWAAENGITGGVDETHFAPNAPCTRAQIVTFLWRSAGCPEPENVSSFADVPADSYYAKAVAWAVEQGITTGTGDGMFSPDATCTRAQAMTFIYRSEQVQGGGMEGDWMFRNPFSDVDLESYYGEAVMWAVANGITTGTSDTTFSPGEDCTRAQIVTFLWRNCAE
ncbi:MAG: S-layer homology domain-containing protein [Bacillota bacterium]|nr:S-layer homology domain-containing protein [Bacillota bacterium]